MKAVKVSTSKVVVAVVAVTLVVIYAVFSDDSLECKDDQDCTIIEVGCYHWEPINITHEEERLQKELYFSCTASEDPGPKPDAYCIDRKCTLIRTEHHWQKMDWPVKKGFTNPIAESCLKKSGVNTESFGYYDHIKIHDKALKLADEYIESNKDDVNKNLDKLLKEAIDCQTLVDLANQM